MKHRKRIAKLIKYPENWDTAAYPTLEDALIEFCAWHQKSDKKD